MVTNQTMSSEYSIVVNQTQSKWFQWIKGLERVECYHSTFLQYLVYIDDLIHDFQAGSQNTGIPNIPSSCPSLADDQSLIGISPLARQSLLGIA